MTFHPAKGYENNSTLCFVCLCIIVYRFVMTALPAVNLIIIVFYIMNQMKYN